MAADPGAPRVTPHPRAGRGLLEELRLCSDTDGFLQLALVRLDLLFETDPARRKKLLRQERMLEAMDRLDWPEIPAQGPERAPRVDLDAVVRAAVELAPEDLRRVRATGSRPLPLIPRGSDPRATGSGPV